MPLKPPSSSKLFWVIASCLVIGLGSLAFFKKKTTIPSSLPKAAAPSLSVVAKVFSARKGAQGLILYGTTEPQVKVDVRAKVTGSVEKIFLKDGVRIKKDQPILLLSLENRNFDLSRAKARFDQHKLDFDAAKILEQRSFQAKLQVARVFADLKQAEADMHKLEEDLQNLTLRSPLEGLLVSSLVEEGDFVQTNNVVAQVVNLNPLKVVVYVAENDYTNIILGQSCKITLSNGQEVDGVISYKAPISENNTHTYQVRLEIENKDHVLPAGLSATVNIPLAEQEVMALPASLLTLNEAGVIGVKAVDEKNIVHFIPIKLLSSDAQRVMVTGIADNTRLIVRGQEFAAEGQSVTVVAEDVSPSPQAEKNETNSAVD